MKIINSEKFVENINESPKAKSIGDPVKLAEAIKAVVETTAPPTGSPQTNAKAGDVDWSKVEAILGAGKHNGMLLQSSFPRKGRLKESVMAMPPFLGVATGINFQRLECSKSFDEQFWSNYSY